MKNKTVIFISIIILIVVIVIFLLSFDDKKEKSSSKFNQTQKIEYGDIAYISDYVTPLDGKLVDKKIKYSELGIIEIEYEIIKNELKEKNKIDLEVVDTTPPVVLLKDSLTIEKNPGTILAEKVFCADNYDPNPKCDVIGIFDVDAVGEYNLIYEAIDSSKNKTSIPFTLKVVEPTVGKSAVDTSTTSFSEVKEKRKNNNTKIGIDVSRYQGNIDWQKVKEAGAEFAMIRLGVQDGFSADNYLDSQFINNITGAIENDLEVGVYFYSYATTLSEAKEQANWVLYVLKDYQITLPVVFDWESWNKFSNLEMSLYDITFIQETFLDIIKEAGYRTSRYGSKNYLTNTWLESSHETWLAHYINETTYEGDYYMWQLCNNGKIDGIHGYVDIDILYVK